MTECSEDNKLFQEAPYPPLLYNLVERCTYRSRWIIRLSSIDRGQGSKGLTLIFTTYGRDTYNPDDENYRVNHYFPVLPAAYDERSWKRWLFEQFLLVERHECMEFFRIDGRRPYAPHHGPGNDCYNVFDHGTAVD